MLEKIPKSNTDTTKKLLDEISFSLQKLETNSSFSYAKDAINHITLLLGIPGNWELFTDDGSKIRRKGEWFHLADGYKDKKATYKIIHNSNKNIDLKAFWVKQKTKSILSWIVALTPNFEDEPFNEKRYNIGIDFIIPNEIDRILVILSKNHILRVLELKGSLNATQQQILGQWLHLDFSNKKILHNDLWKGFDLQPINKEFYKGICSYFYELRNFLRIEKSFSEKESNIFTIRLLGRIIFCWFLDKKGFIENSNNYLNPQSNQEDRIYYDKFLRTLFFTLLNTPKKQRPQEFKKHQNTLP